MEYARYISETEAQYPTDEEFVGVPNWQTHDPLLRSRGYIPLVGEAEPREGYVAIPSGFARHEATATHTEPRPYIVEDWEEDLETHERRKVGEHTEWRDTEIVTDASWIEVTEWDYEPVPPPEPVVKKYSKLRLYDALKSAGIWGEVKSAIEDADQWERWELANELSTDYQPFSLMLEGLRREFGDATVDEILSYAEIGEA